MPGHYTIKVTPHILVQGDRRGHLEFLTFVATTGDETQRWSTVNDGKIVDDLTRIVGPDTGGILMRLFRGETVELPGHYSLEDIKFKVGGRGNS